MVSSGVRGICLWRIRVHRSMPHLRQCLCGSSAWFVPGSFVGVPIEIKATNAVGFRLGMSSLAQPARMHAVLAAISMAHLCALRCGSPVFRMSIGESPPSPSDGVEPRHSWEGAKTPLGTHVEVFGQAVHCSAEQYASGFFMCYLLFCFLSRPSAASSMRMWSLRPGCSRPALELH